MERDDIARGQKCSLATHRNPLNVVAGTLDNKSDRRTMKQVQNIHLKKKIYIYIRKIIEIDNCK